MICQDCGYDMGSMKNPKKCPRCGKKFGSNKNKKGGKAVTVFAIFLSVISVLLLVVGFYMLSSPKTVMLQGITKFANQLKTITAASETDFTQKLVVEDKIKMDADITVESAIPEFTFDEFKLNMVYLENRLDKKSDIDLNLYSGEENLIGLDMLFADSKVYMSVKDITDKYYYTDFDYVSLFENVADVDYDKLIDILKNNLTEMIDEENIDKVKEVITLDGKERKTTKLSYVLTTTMMNDCMRGILEDIKADQDLVKELAKTYSLTEEEFVTSIDEAMADLTLDEDMEEESINYNVYYYGLNNIVRQELGDEELIIRLDSYADVTEFSILEFMTEPEEVTTLLNVKVVKENNVYKITGNLDEYTFEGDYSETEKDATLNLKVNLDAEQYLTLKMTTTLQETSDSYTSDMKINLAGVIEGMDLGDGITLGISATYTFGETVPETDLSTAQDASLMTEEEMNTILLNVQNHPFLSTVYQYLMAFDGNEDMEYEDLEDDMMMNDIVIEYE